MADDTGPGGQNPPQPPPPICPVCQTRHTGQCREATDPGPGE